MKIVLCFALLVAVAAAASPPRPNFPTMYEAQTVNEFRNGTHRFVGDGWQAVDIPANKAVEGYNFDVAFSHFALQRGDLHRAYDIDTRLTHLGQCHERNITGTLPNPWAWVANAQSAGAPDTGTQAPHRPIVFSTHWTDSAGHFERYSAEYITFVSHKPQDGWFAVPH